MILKIKQAPFFLKPVYKRYPKKSLTIPTEHYNENQDKVKSSACLQPIKKKPQICSGKTPIFIPDEASKNLKPKDPLFCHLLNLSVLSTYLVSKVSIHSLNFQRIWKSEYSKFAQTWFTLSPMKWNPHLFFQRDFSPGVHMLRATEESQAAVVSCTKHWRAGKLKGLVLSWGLC